MNKKLILSMVLILSVFLIGWIYLDQTKPIFISVSSTQPAPIVVYTANQTPSTNPSYNVSVNYNAQPNELVNQTTGKKIVPLVNPSAPTNMRCHITTDINSPIFDCNLIYGSLNHDMNENATFDYSSCSSLQATACSPHTLLAIFQNNTIASICHYVCNINGNPNEQGYAFYE